MSDHLDELDGVAATIRDDFVATVELQRPPNNFFDIRMIRRIADLYEALAADRRVRVIVLCAQGKHFCAGADLSGRDSPASGPRELYREAVRVFAGTLPVVAAVQGAAIGGGLGLACSADFRLASPNARFAANFAQLGFHHGFALSATLPRIVGQQHALDLLYTGRRIDGADAARIGLVDRVVDADQLRDAALELATDNWSMPSGRLSIGRRPSSCACSRPQISARGSARRPNGANPPSEANDRCRTRAWSGPSC
jgi:enoyl-CoA hydratase/carnithine racemase